MEVAPVQDNSQAPHEIVDADPVNDEPEYETQYKILCAAITDMKATLASYSLRLFGTASNYAVRMELADDAPKKQDFRTLSARFTALQKEVDKMYKHQKPKAVKEAGTTKHTGFNRLVLASPELTAFMKLGDWGLLSEVDPRKGVVTHGLITRYVSNYAALHALPSAEDSSCWVADAAILELFKEQWGPTQVNPKRVRWTDVQKLIKPHMTKCPDGGHEIRNADTYRAKLDDDGEFGAATKSVLTLRKQIVDLETVAHKRGAVLKHCRANRPGQGIVAKFEALVKQDLAAHKKLSDELRAQCDKYDFSYAPNYPAVPALL